MLRLWLTPAASVAILVATAAAFQPRSDPDTRAACLVDIMDGAVQGAGTHGVHIGPEYREHLIPSKGTPPVIDGEIAEEGESFRLGQDGMQFGSVRADQLDSTQESKLVHADLLPTMGPRRTAMLRGVTGPPRRTNATPNRIRTRPAGSNGMFPTTASSWHTRSAWAAGHAPSPRGPEDRVRITTAVPLRGGASGAAEPDSVNVAGASAQSGQERANGRELAAMHAGRKIMPVTSLSIATAKPPS